MPKKWISAATIMLLSAVVFVFSAHEPKGALAQGNNILVLRGGTLIDGTGRAPIQDAVVVLQNGRVQSVGAAGSTTVPSGATVIDTTGKTIMPGLFDSHAHFRNYQ